MYQHDADEGARMEWEATAHGFTCQVNADWLLICNPKKKGKEWSWEASGPTGYDVFGGWASSKEDGQRAAEAMYRGLQGTDARERAALQERAVIVAYLREQSAMFDAPTLAEAADDIETGEHLT
jgi:hypothetical protein